MSHCCRSSSSESSSSEEEVEGEENDYLDEENRYERASPNASKDSTNEEEEIRDEESDDSDGDGGCNDITQGDGIEGDMCRSGVENGVSADSIPDPHPDGGERENVPRSRDPGVSTEQDGDAELSTHQSDNLGCDEDRFFCSWREMPSFVSDDAWRPIEICRQLSALTSRLNRLAEKISGGGLGGGGGSPTKNDEERQQQQSTTLQEGATVQKKRRVGKLASETASEITSISAALKDANDRIHSCVMEYTKAAMIRAQTPELLGYGTLLACSQQFKERLAGAYAHHNNQMQQQQQQGKDAGDAKTKSAKTKRKKGGRMKNQTRASAPKKGCGSGSGGGGGGVGGGQKSDKSDEVGKDLKDIDRIIFEEFPQ